MRRRGHPGSAWVEVLADDRTLRLDGEMAPAGVLVASRITARSPVTVSSSESPNLDTAPFVDLEHGPVPQSQPDMQERSRVLSGWLVIAGPTP
jgi:hypothetical protein